MGFCFIDTRASDVALNRNIVPKNVKLRRPFHFQDLVTFPQQRKGILPELIEITILTWEMICTIFTSVSERSLETNTSRSATASEPKLAYIDMGAT
jgi:hypothetical protein